MWEAIFFLRHSLTFIKKIFLFSSNKLNAITLQKAVSLEAKKQYYYK